MLWWGSVRSLVCCVLLFAASNAWSLTGSSIITVCTSPIGTEHYGRCTGYLFAMYEMGASTRRFCMPPINNDSSNGRLRETMMDRQRKMAGAVLAYYANNLGVVEEGATKHIFSALSAVWPCTTLSGKIAPPANPIRPF